MSTWSEFSFILQPSPLGGVGVFTTHDLVTGTQIFSGEFHPRKMKIADIPEAFKKYIIYLNEEECLCPEMFNQMEIGWYLNHSNQPNIAKQADGLIFTIRDIKKGEEVLIDYNHLNEPDHLKEAYYREAAK